MALIHRFDDETDPGVDGGDCLGMAISPSMKEDLKREREEEGDGFLGMAISPTMKEDLRRCRGDKRKRKNR